MSYCGHPFVRWVAAGALCLSLGACAGRAPSPPVEPVPARAPVLTPQQVLATLHAREANVTSLKGLFQAEAEGSFSPFSHRVQGTLFYQRPRSIRIKGFTRFGGTLFDFLLHDRSYALHTAGRRYPMVGRAPDFRPLGNLGLPVQLSLRAVDVLLGRLRWTAEQFREVRVAKTAYRYTAALSHGNSPNVSVLQHVWVDHSSALIQGIEYYSTKGKKLITLTASDYRKVGPPDQPDSVVLPFSIEVKEYVTSGSVSLKFSEIVPNVPVPGKEFEFQ